MILPTTSLTASSKCSCSPVPARRSRRPRSWATVSSESICVSTRTISHNSLWNARRHTFLYFRRRPSRSPRRASELDPLENECQLGHLHLDLDDPIALDRREPKGALLEALRPKAEAAAIPVDRLCHRPPPIEEEEEIAGEWFSAERTPDSASEPVELLAHVERL